MPIFEYVCRECNHRFELLMQGSAEAVPAAEPASKADAEKDKALLGSLKNELNSLIDEEDD